MGRVNLHAGWGRFGSLRWHETHLNAAESTEEVAKYLLALGIEPPSASSEDDRKVAMCLIKKAAVKHSALQGEFS